MKTVLQICGFFIFILVGIIPPTILISTILLSPSLLIFPELWKKITTPELEEIIKLSFLIWVAAIAFFLIITMIVHCFQKEKPEKKNEEWIKKYNQQPELKSF